MGAFEDRVRGHLEKLAAHPQGDLPLNSTKQQGAAWVQTALASAKKRAAAKTSSLAAARRKVQTSSFLPGETGKNWASRQVYAAKQRVNSRPKPAQTAKQRPAGPVPKLPPVPTKARPVVGDFQTIPLKMKTALASTRKEFDKTWGPQIKTDGHGSNTWYPKDTVGSSTTGRMLDDAVHNIAYKINSVVEPNNYGKNADKFFRTYWDARAKALNQRSRPTANVSKRQNPALPKTPTAKAPAAPQKAVKKAPQVPPASKAPSKGLPSASGPQGMSMVKKPKDTVADVYRAAGVMARTAPKAAAAQAPTPQAKAVVKQSPTPVNRIGTIKKGQGYNALAAQFGGKMTGAALRKRMGGQTLYAGRKYDFSKGMDAGGLGAKRLARSRASGKRQLAARLAKRSAPKPAAPVKKAVPQPTTRSSPFSSGAGASPIAGKAPRTTPMRM